VFNRNIAYWLFNWGTVSDKKLEEEQELIPKPQTQPEPRPVRPNVFMPAVISTLDKCVDKILYAAEPAYRFIRACCYSVNIFHPIARFLKLLVKLVLTATERFYSLIFIQPIEDFVADFARTFVYKAKKTYHIIFFSAFLIYFTNSIAPGRPGTKLQFMYVFCVFVVLCIVNKPFIGLLIYYGTQLIILKEIIWFPDYAIPVGTPLLFLTIGLWVLGKLMHKGEKLRLYQNQVNYVIIFLWFMLSWSTLYTNATVEVYLNLTTLFMSYFWAVQIIGKDKRKFTNFLIFACSIYGFYAYRVIRNGLYFGFGTSHAVTAGFSSGALSDNNELAAVMGVGASFLLAYYFTSKNKLAKVVSLFVFGMLIVAVILTNSRGGLIGISVALLSLCFNIVLRRKKIGVFLVLGVVLGSLGGYIFAPQITEHVHDILHWDKVPSAQNRVIGIWGGLEILKKNPLLGCGLDQLQNEILDVIPPLVAIPNVNFWEYFTQENPREYIYLEKPRNKLVVHNAYISIGAQGGVAVLILFPAMIIFTIYSQRSFRKSVEKKSELAWAVNVSYCLETGLYTYMVTAFFLNNYMGNTLYLVILMSSCLINVASEEHRKAMSGTQFFFIIACFLCWSYFFMYYYLFSHI